MPRFRPCLDTSAVFALTSVVGLALVVVSPAVAQQASSQPSFSGQPAPSTGLRGTDPGSTANAGAFSAAPADPDPLASASPFSTGSANYGKPKPKPDPKLKYAARPKTPPRPLPPLVPYPTSAQARQKPVQPLRPGDVAPPPAPNVAVVPLIPQPPRPKVEQDPYAPLGIGVGGLRLTPYVETDVSYDTNPNRVPTPTNGSWALRGETGVALKSDWSTHELTGAGQFGYTRYFQQEDASRPDGQGRLDLKLNVNRDLTADFELRGAVTTQRPGTPGIGANVSSRPLVLTTGLTAGGTETLGRLQLGLHGTIDRTTNQDGTLSDGTVVPLSNGNYNAYGLQPRVAYEVTPGITPFVEGTVDTRKRDQALDTLGYARDSNGASARVGTTFELSRILTGQIAVGYAERSYADARLKSISTPTVDASLVWTATPLTTATLRGATTINETTVANSAGAVNRVASLEISHALMRNVTLGAIGSVGVNDYSGVNLREVTYSGTLKADYALSRSVVIRGSFTHERLQSTAVGADYTANVFLLGLKLQR